MRWLTRRCQPIKIVALRSKNDSSRGTSKRRSPPTRCATVCSNHSPLACHAVRVDTWLCERYCASPSCEELTSSIKPNLYSADVYVYENNYMFMNILIAWGLLVTLVDRQNAPIGPHRAAKDWHRESSFSNTSFQTKHNLFYFEHLILDQEITNTK